MELTIQAIEKVMEETGMEYKDAKALLEENENDPEKAIGKFFEEVPEDDKKKTDDIISQIKALVEKGNVERVQIRKGEQIVFSVPVNIGIIGGVLGLAYAPWALIAGAVASFGFGCQIEVVKEDGTTESVI